MKDWRVEHPKATLSELEKALDERLGRLRGQMLEDSALVSAATSWETAKNDCRVCPKWGVNLG
ncbi:MAG: hypothetical protein ACYDBJ_18685 [Aggregatilineales bacterium]